MLQELTGALSSGLDQVVSALFSGLVIPTIGGKKIVKS